MRKEPEQKQNIGSRWHTDHSYDDAPALGSMIYALEVPPVGGDTLFANMSLAYETLSDGMKALLSKLEAVHSSRHVFGPGYKANLDVSDRFRNAEQAVQDAAHPVVIRHPDTGRKVLYVNPTFTVRFERLDRGGVQAVARLPLRALPPSPSSPAECNGGKAPSACGTTVRRGTWRSTTTPAIAA